MIHLPLVLYNKGQENTKDLHEKTSFGGFWAEIKNIAQMTQMTKERQKLSFDAGRVELMTETWIMGTVIDFTGQQKEKFVLHGG